MNRIKLKPLNLSFVRGRALLALKTLALLFLSLMAACTPKQSSDSSYEITGTQAERIAAVSKIISKHAPLPSSLLAARFVEQQAGDGRLGPSDFTAFYVLTVAATNIPAWRSTLTPLQSTNSPPEYVAPIKSFLWWLSLDDFRHLEFYSPKSLTGRSHGWVGVAPQSGKIFVYAFTM